MMDCKRALEETGGDLEAARTLLREQGMAQAAKRAGRATTEGLVGYRIEGDAGTMVAVGCETEPVSKNEEFQAFAKKVLEAVARRRARRRRVARGGSRDSARKLGENIVVVGAERYEVGDGEVVDALRAPAGEQDRRARASSRAAARSWRASWRCTSRSRRPSG